MYILKKYSDNDSGNHRISACARVTLTVPHMVEYADGLKPEDIHYTSLIICKTQKGYSFIPCPVCACAYKPTHRPLTVNVTTRSKEFPSPPVSTTAHKSFSAEDS